MNNAITTASEQPVEKQKQKTKTKQKKKKKKTLEMKTSTLQAPNRHPRLRYFYSPALKKWGLYWIYLVLPSFCHFVITSFCDSVIPKPLKGKFFVIHFSGTVRPRRLKLGTHVGSHGGQMYRVYRNRAAAAYSSLYFLIFLSLQFSNIKIFRHTFLRKYEA